MTLKSQMVIDKAAICNVGEFGEAISYNFHETGVTISISADLSINSNLAAYVAGNTQAQMGTAELWKADVPTPKRYDLVTRSDGSVWSVESIMREDSASSTVLISTAVRAS